MMKNKWYSLDRILEHNAQYNIIFGERSNGKSFSVWDYALKNFAETGKQFAVIRRYGEDFKGKRAYNASDGIVSENRVKLHTNGKFSLIDYYSGRYFLANRVDGKIVRSDEPFGYTFALSSMEHDKSTSYNNVGTILFDEFITRQYYLIDEFIIFMNVLSTIIRQREDCKVFMLGNTVNKYCPYFKEMGLHKVFNMEQGKIDIYRFGDSELKIAVEYVTPTAKGKSSDVFFAFDNPKLKMITGGSWEMDIYPHCPIDKIKSSDIIFKYFIEFDRHILQCDIVRHELGDFTFIHFKTTELKTPNDDIIFTTRTVNNVLTRRNITKPYDKIGKHIYEFFKKEKVFYASNEVGEVVRNYLQWCD